MLPSSAMRFSSFDGGVDDDCIAAAVKGDRTQLDATCCGVPPPGDDYCKGQRYQGDLAAARSLGALVAAADCSLSKGAKNGGCASGDFVDAFIGAAGASGPCDGERKKWMLAALAAGGALVLLFLFLLVRGSA
jgi:hypothetical protein